MNDEFTSLSKAKRDMQSSLGGASKRSRGSLSPRGRRGRYNDVDDVIEEDEARGSKRFLSEVRRWRSIEMVSLERKSRRGKKALFFAVLAAQNAAPSPHKKKQQTGHRSEHHEPPPGRCDGAQGAGVRSSSQNSENGGRREQRRRRRRRRRSRERQRQRRRQRQRPRKQRVGLRLPDPDDGRRQRVLEGPELRVAGAGL